MKYLSRTCFFIIAAIFIAGLSASGQPTDKYDNNLLDLILTEDTAALAQELNDKSLINKRYGEEKRTLLSYAIEYNKTISASFLIKRGADIEKRDGTKTPLMFAARYNNIPIAEMLIEAGADVNVINNDRNTAFHYAAKYNNFELIKYFYKQGAKINIPNEDSWTALDYSIINNMPEIKEYLLSIGCILYKKKLPDCFDGPHFLISDSSSMIQEYHINENNKKGSYILSKSVLITNPVLSVPGLKKDRNNYNIEVNPDVPPSIYKEQNKVFAIGDIHGEYERMLEILRAGKVIDKRKNWIWGTNHLVFMGDIFDRGDGVTEALWFIYNLEQQAEKAGGRVHYLMGNHEAMILKNDIRYLSNKYYGLMTNLDRTYVEIFDEESILGRWLRTKNVVERIGNTLFVHAGISPSLFEDSLSIEEINSRFRHFLNTNPEDYTDNDRKIISSTGPVWYRGYLKRSGKIPEIQQHELNTILDFYDAGQVVVGHTEVELIEPLKENKVFPINIPLADKSIIGQALLIESDRIYRVDAKKNKTLLFNRP
ncbi:MAG: ankyrin repeat domain-containing protein [Marinilabiliaceae bacterium]|jgi:ankyrin repeat protein|nr:ankyrin repeat domain-containing protein [Marinilabiliaceae bacterium]